MSKPAAPIQIKPLSINATVNHLRTWSELSAVTCMRHLTTDEHFYFVARDRIQEDWQRIEVRVNRQGYMVKESRYHDIWKRPVVMPDEYAEVWQNIDSIALGGDDD